MKPDVAARPTDRRPHGLALANAFTMPVVSPMSVPPPYRYRGCRAVNILFRTDPGALEPLVPAPLQVDPDQPSVLYIGHFELADFDMPYNEAGLLVPVVGKGMSAGSFAVVLYLDRANPIVGGREVYGWPKKDAEEVLFRDVGTSISAVVTRYGRRIITVGFEVEQRVAPVPERSPTPIYFVKLIPSVQQDAPPDVLKLNSMVITPDVITKLRVGKGHLEFGNSPYDPFLASIPVREVVYAEAVVHDFTLGYGEVVVDYLAEPTA